MPNHLHGIIGIVDDPDPDVRANSDSCKGTIQAPQRVRANSNLPQRDKLQPPTFKSPSKTTGAIIRGFKSAVTKKINIMRNTPNVPIWQRNYYERIVKNEPELNRIRKYIIENPIKWYYDKYYEIKNS